MQLPRKEHTVTSSPWMSALLVLSLLLSGASPAVARQGPGAPLQLRPEQAAGHRADLEQVLSVVEHRTKDERVVAKMRDKLSGMSGRHLRLAVSLCDRIARSDDGPGADVAFSIVMALVVLS